MAVVLVACVDALFLLAVVTQVFYFFWNAKSIICYTRSDRGKLFADVGFQHQPIPDGTGNLPKITAILAARNESEAILRRSLLSLLSLNYPAYKKEILLVTDRDDEETGAIADRLSRELGVTHVVVPENKDPSWTRLIYEARSRGAKWADIDPDQLPASKPRALTYALSKATGQIITVVDAEDVQADVKVFRKAAECLQAKAYDAVQGRLRFINYKDSWLSLQSIGDYAYWFAWLLPKVRNRGLPVAFGGTSYYIRRETLDKLAGWDPTNVTEDLELGLRLYGYGHRVGIIDVDTYEESPRRLLRTRSEGGWANQRTRWIRGTLYTISRLGKYWGDFPLRRRAAIAFLLSYYLLAFFVPFLSVFGYPFMVLPFIAVFLIQMRLGNVFEQRAIHQLLLPLIQNQWLAALSTVNMLLLLWHVFLTTRGIADTVGNAIHSVWAKIYYYGLAASTIMFYWILWGLPVLRAISQTVSGARFWEKTLHEGLHHPVLDELAPTKKHPES